MQQRFKGQRVVVSGACGGFGRAMARQFGEEGAALVLLDRNADDLQALRDSLVGEIECIAYDQTVDASIDRTLEQVRRADIFVNNAGATLRKPLVDFSAGEMRQIFDLNLYGAIRMATGVARLMMREGGGVITNVASQLAFCSEPERGIYSVAKAGMVQFTKSSAREWVAHGIRTFAIAPGVAETGMTANMTDEAMVHLMSKVPGGKLIQPEDIARMACFLASEEARCFVGQTIIVDSGYLLH